MRANGESHLEVGDRSNDAVRIRAANLRAQVVGEGANLGMTQRARIQYGQAGGRMNTDAIDNSAGVDCSDHEVNIKILLGEVERAGDMTRKQRDQLLRKMTNEVGELVLRDNYLQTQALTVTHQMGVHLLDRLGRFMRSLEKEDRLDPEIEFLPDDDTLAERFKTGIGFTRPELSVLLGYAKIVLNDELLFSDLPDDPYMEVDLRNYFPAPLQKKYAKQIATHRLRREIITTVITNEIINRVGITFIHEVREKTGMGPDDIARSYVVSREIFGMPSLWSRIEALDSEIPSALQAAMLVECGRQLERGTVWFMRESAHPLQIQAEVEAFADGVQEFGNCVESLLSSADQAALAAQRSTFVEQGVPQELADHVARLPFLPPACDVARLARDADLPVSDVAGVYFAVGSRFGFDWLRRAAGHLPSDTAWDKRAVSATLDDLFSHQSALTRSVLEFQREERPVRAVIEAWAWQRRAAVIRTDQLLAELQAVGSPDFAMLAVANRQLKSMIG